MNKDTIRQIGVVVAVLATIGLNSLANILPLNGLTTGEISDRFDVFFVPAGYVFSIWSLIYLGLLAYAVYQALPSQRNNPRLQRIAPLFIASCAANVGWLFLWHYEFFALTLVAMVTLLVLLILVYVGLGIGTSSSPTGERWLVRLPFSIYLGWISVATIANATSLLDYLNWGGFGLSGATWALIMLLVGLAVAAGMILGRGDAAYGLVIVWAFVGIAVNHGDTALVAYTAWAAAAAAAILVLLTFFRRPTSLEAQLSAG